MTYKVGGILLAAGLSRRAGDINKLMVPIDGIAMARRCLTSLINSGCDPIYVVTGHEAKRIEAELTSDAVSFVHNKDFEEGMASSIRTGVGMMEKNVDAVLIALGDMPHVKPVTYKALINNYAPEQGHEICMPNDQGKPGNPVLFGRRFFSDLTNISGDKGAKSIALKNAEFVVDVAVDDPGIHLDHDTF